jgi:hypothetical protein
MGKEYLDPREMDEIRIRLLIPFMILATALAGCQASAPPPATTSQATAASIIPDLKSAEYPLDLSPTGSVQLKDGLFEGAPAAPGSATRLTVRLGDMLATGDINGDGTEDAAVILIADPGGSGTFSYLAVVLNQQQKPGAAASIFLGDRIIIEALSIQAGMIRVSFLDHDPGQPMASPPSIEEERTYAYRNGILEQVPD